MKRPAYSVLFLVILGLSALPGALAQSPHARGHRSYAVRVAASALPPGSSSMDIGPTLWSMEGYDLRAVLAQVYGIDTARIALPAGAEDAEVARLDVTVPLTGEESEETVRGVLREAIESRLKLSLREESRTEDVYVIRAPRGAGPGLVRSRVAENRHGSTLVSSEGRVDAAEAITVTGQICPGVSSVGIAARVASIGQLASALEENLDKAVVNESGLSAAYDFVIPEFKSREQLFQYMQDRLGLVVTLERRQVGIVRVERSGQAKI